MKAIVVFIFTLLFPLPLQANESQNSSEIYIHSLKELMSIQVSVASKRSENMKDAPGIVSVITRDEIHRYGFRTLEDLLNMIPGFTTTREIDRLASGRGLIVRGASSDFGQTVLFLVNGNKTNDIMTGGGLQFTPDYPLENIKQVEVIRGPGSTLYGANAFLAVVNIVTDGRDFKDQSIVEVKAGVNKGRSATIKGERIINDDFQIAMSAQFYNYEGDDIDTPDVSITDTLGNTNTYRDHVLRDTLEMSDIMLRAAYKDFLLHVNHKKYKADNIGAIGLARNGTLIDSLGIDHTGVFRSSNFMHGDSEHFNTSVNYASDLSATLRIDVTATWDKSESATQYPLTQAFIRVPIGITGDLIDKDVSIDNEYQADSINVDTFIEWSGHENHTVTLGAGYNRSYGEGILKVPFADTDGDAVAETYVLDAPFFNDPPKKIGRKSSSYYLQDTWDFSKKFTLTSGIRYDDFDDFGNTTNYKAALLYKPTDQWSVKTMVGTAFRAPSIIEAYTETPPFLTVDENIGPEELESLELQVIFTPHTRFVYSANLYRHDIDEVLRQFSTNNPSNSLEQSYQNIGRRKLTGVEIEGRGQWINNVSAFFGYTHVIEASDALNGSIKDIEGIPEDTLNLGVNMQPEQLQDWLFGFSAQARWNFFESKTNTVFPGAGDFTIDNYVIADMNIIKNNVLAVDGLQTSLLVHNIFNNTKNTARNLSFHPRGVPLDNRQILLGLRYQF